MTAIQRERIRTHDEKGQPAWMEVLPVGTRVRHKRTPHLTGYVHHHEYHESGAISPIPYRIEWDDNDEAYRVLGMLAIYASDEGVEPMP